MNNSHDHYLNNLINRLYEVDENLYQMKWIMKDGVWLHEDSLDRHKLCDLICIYDGFGVPIELKGDKKKRNNAVEQIRSGQHFIRDELELECSYGRFVVYTVNGYYQERINL